MQTTVDAAPHPGRRAWFRWLAVALVIVVAVGTALLVRGLGGSQAAEPTLPDLLADRVVEVLEQASPDEHADHGHHLLGEGEQAGLLCVAEVFGFDPPGAATVAEVEAVYVHHACAEVGTGFTWPSAVRATGPIAVELTTDPMTVLLPSQALPDQEEILHADRVRAVIPAQYHDGAFAHEGFTSPTLLEELRQRFEAAD